MGEARKKRKGQKLLEERTEKSLPQPPLLPVQKAPPRSNSVLETHRARAGEGGRDEVN